jgi:hypothetical protein
MAFSGITTDKVRIGQDDVTGERGVMIQLLNKTGVASVKGSIIEPNGGTDAAFSLCGANALDPIGSVYEAGVADGSLCWVWMPGSMCQVLLEDGTASTREYWVKVGATTAGRADASLAAPSGSSFAEVTEHFREIGHAAESKTAGTDVLSLVHMHFN